jgi:hypothetical protein
MNLKKKEVNMNSDESLSCLYFPYPGVALTSREALARSCSVGHFYSPKTDKKSQNDGISLYTHPKI